MNWRTGVVLGVLAACGIVWEGDAAAQPRPNREKAAKKQPEAAAPKNNKTAGNSVPDLTGVWAGQIQGMGGGGGRGPGGSPGGRRNAGGGGGGGTRQMQVELTIDETTIKGLEMGGGGQGRDLGTGKYQLTGNATRGNLDAEGTAGREDGRTFLGIYELKGDELRWSVSNRRFRPKGFALQGGNYVLVLKRQKS